MFLPMFLTGFMFSTIGLLIAIIGYIWARYCMFKTKNNFDYGETIFKRFSIFIPIAIIGAINMAVAVMLKFFGYIR